MKKVIVFDGVHFTYEDDVKEVLQGIDVSFEDNSFVAIIGRNGSGKSTFSKQINALFVPTLGSVKTMDLSTADENNWLAIRQKAGMVFQNPDNQMVTSIVNEDVAFGPENLGIEPSEIRKRVEESLKLVDMENFWNAAPHHLSGGQKQRVAIAGVLAMEPDILILDESTAMLDPIGRKEIMKTVLALRKDRKICVIWITHFMEEASLADRIIVLSDGMIQMDGTPMEVFSKTNQLAELGLEVPFDFALAEQLRQAGIPIQNTLSQEELVEEICHYLLKN